MENKKRSGGPRTEVGKARSSQNARKHGILSDKAYLLQNENPAEWEHLKALCYQKFQPRDEFEQRLVDKIACAQWRMDRLIATETAIVVHKMDDQEEHIRETYLEVDEPARTALAIQALADRSNVLQLLQRYESHLERSYNRCIKALMDLRAKKKWVENTETVQDLPNELKTRRKAAEPEPAAVTESVPETSKIPNELPAPSFGRRKPPAGETLEVPANPYLAVELSPARPQLRL